MRRPGRPETGVVLRFVVDAVPKPQGSMRAGLRGGRVRVWHESGRELTAWRAWTYAAAIRAARTAGLTLPLDGPLAVSYEFRLPRPASVKRPLPCVKPDLDKLVRAVNDALGEPGTLGRVIAEDSRIVDVSASKRYAEAEGRGPGVTVTVRRWTS